MFLQHFILFLLNFCSIKSSKVVEENCQNFSYVFHWVRCVSNISFEKNWFSISWFVFVSVKWSGRSMSQLLLLGVKQITFTVFFGCCSYRLRFAVMKIATLNNTWSLTWILASWGPWPRKTRSSANMHPFSPKTFGEQRLHFIADRTPCPCGMQRPMPSETYSPFCSLG